MTFGVAAAWSAAVYLALGGLISLSVALRPSASTDLVHLVLCEAVVFLFFTFLILRKHAAERTLSQALALRSTQPWLIVIGLSLGLSLRIPAELISQLVERVAPTPEAVLLERSQLLRHETLSDVIVMLLGLAIVVPLIEELLYRGALFAPLARERGLSGAAIFTLLAFVLTHGEPRDWAALSVVGLVMSYLRAASGSLLPSLALHVGFNTSAVLIWVSGLVGVTESVELPVPVVIGSLGLTGLLMFAVYRISCHSELALQARQEDVE